MWLRCDQGLDFSQAALVDVGGTVLRPGSGVDVGRAGIPPTHQAGRLDFAVGLRQYIVRVPMFDGGGECRHSPGCIAFVLLTGVSVGEKHVGVGLRLQLRLDFALLPGFN